MIPKDGLADADQIEAAQNEGIQYFETVADVIDTYDCNTLVNATHNPSHIAVLKDAFSTRQPDGRLRIQIVFQEKPFAHDLKEAEEIEGFIADEGITFNLNGILSFSPIWEQFSNSKDRLHDNGFQLVGVKCTYGKDRTKDTRPAPNGWVGMEAIHALDISTFGFEDVQIQPESIKAISGFLAEHANGAGGDGIVPFGHESKMIAKTPDGNSVTIEIEGSFAWDKQHRRAQYEFEHPDGRRAILELEFDRRVDGAAQDVLMGAVYDQKGQLIAPVETAVSHADKLLGYYKSVTRPDTARPQYSLSKAMSVQSALDTMLKPAYVTQIDAKASPKHPKLFTSIAGHKTPKAPGSRIVVQKPVGV